MSSVVGVTNIMIFQIKGQLVNVMDYYAGVVAFSGYCFFKSDIAEYSTVEYYWKDLEGKYKKK